jgi:hypothetical protein
MPIWIEDVQRTLSRQRGVIARAKVLQSGASDNAIRTKLRSHPRLAGARFTESVDVDAERNNRPDRGGHCPGQRAPDRLMTSPVWPRSSRSRCSISTS